MKKTLPYKDKMKKKLTLQKTFNLKNRETKNQRTGGTVQRKIKLSSGNNFYMTRKYKD